MAAAALINCGHSTSCMMIQWATHTAAPSGMSDISRNMQMVQNYFSKRKLRLPSVRSDCSSRSCVLEGSACKTISLMGLDMFA